MRAVFYWKRVTREFELSGQSFIGLKAPRNYRRRHFIIAKNKSAPYPRLKNSKRTSNCQFTVLENRKSKKYEPSGAPGPASASPWRAKRGTLPKLSTFLSQLKGGPFGEKTNFRKKSHNAEKLKGGPFGIFKHPICCKISKKLKGDPLEKKTNFRKKVSMPKN